VPRTPAITSDAPALPPVRLIGWIDKDSVICASCRATNPSYKGTKPQTQLGTEKTRPVLLPSQRNAELSLGRNPTRCGYRTTTQWQLPG